MSSNAFQIGSYLGTFLLLIGIGYKYWIKRQKRDFKTAFFFIVGSYLAGIAFITFIRGLDLAIFNSELLGDVFGELGNIDLRTIAFVGSTFGIGVIVYSYIQLLNAEKITWQAPRKKKRRKKSVEGEKQ